MTVDREQARRDARKIAEDLREALHASADAVDRLVAILLAELEQAARERDDAIEEKDGWMEEAKTYEERVKTLSAFYENAVTNVPALVEAAQNALSWIENYPLNLRDEFNDDWRAIAQALREALS